MSLKITYTASVTLVALVPVAKQLQDIEKLIKSKVEREEIENFEPGHVVPESVSTKPTNSKNRTKKSGQKNVSRKVTNEQRARDRNRNSSSAKKSNHNNGNRAQIFTQKESLAV